MAAVFPGYLGQLRGARFLSHSIDAARERREACRVEPVRQHMTTEHIDVGPDYSDTHTAAWSCGWDASGSVSECGHANPCEMGRIAP